MSRELASRAFPSVIEPWSPGIASAIFAGVNPQQVDLLFEHPAARIEALAEEKSGIPIKVMVDRGRVGQFEIELCRFSIWLTAGHSRRVSPLHISRKGDRSMPC